jgi:aspartyl-tRNA(Asn)/glutamyl-tRNA(Gln) amidotransferase subunit C
MKIEDVNNLARLARIDLPEKEKEQILKDMESILDYVGQVEEANPGEVEVKKTSYNLWREDRLEPRQFFLDGIIEQFPDKEGRYLKVKKIL